MDRGTLRDESISIFDRYGDLLPFDDIKANVVWAAIHHYHGNLSQVSQHLRISRSALYDLVHGDADLGHALEQVRG